MRHSLHAVCNVSYNYCNHQNSPGASFMKSLRLTRLDFLINEFMLLPEPVRKYSLVRPKGFMKVYT